VVVVESVTTSSIQYAWRTALMANQEHVSILKQGVSIWNTWREANPEVKPDLSEVHLVKATLRGANLSDVNLFRAYLYRARLTRAYLGGAYLRGAYLARADLRQAILAGADLAAAHLNSANLAGADLAKRVDR
jgi:uncharacterized protein YjbI with pentapeptide repeats